MQSQRQVQNSRGKAAPLPELGSADFPTAMADVPSLLSLCTNAITSDLISGGDHDLEALYELPSDLFLHRTTLALHNLQGDLSMNSSSDEAYVANCTKLKRKRERDGDFYET